MNYIDYAIAENKAIEFRRSVMGETMCKLFGAQERLDPLMRMDGEPIGTYAERLGKWYGENHRNADIISDRINYENAKDSKQELAKWDIKSLATVDVILPAKEKETPNALLNAVSYMTVSASVEGEALRITAKKHNVRFADIVRRETKRAMLENGNVKPKHEDKLTGSLRAFEGMHVMFRLFIRSAVLTLNPTDKTFAELPECMMSEYPEFAKYSKNGGVDQLNRIYKTFFPDVKFGVNRKFVGALQHACLRVKPNGSVSVCKLEEFAELFIVYSRYLLNHADIQFVDPSHIIEGTKTEAKESGAPDSNSEKIFK